MPTDLDASPAPRAVLAAPAIVATRRTSRAVMLAVLLLSGSGLLFELTLTRIFSATIWYHYAFVAISVALFGWGLGGFLVYLLRLSQSRYVRGVTLTLALLPALLMPIFLVTILQYPFTPERLNLYFLMSLLPFMASGAALSLVFEIHGHDSNRLYFADLIGAAGGVLAVPIVIGMLGAETTVLAAAIMPAAAAALLVRGLYKDGRPGLSVLIVVPVMLLNFLLTGWNYRAEKLVIRDAPGKALYQLLSEDRVNNTIESDRWNAYSRITAVNTPKGDNLARLFIDSDAWTNVMRWDGKPESLAEGRTWFRSLAFRTKPDPRVLVIGPGGGTDVVLALAAGSPKVTAVEMNPLMIDCVRHYGDKAGNLYEHPNVQLVMDEGRNFIQRTPEKFDVIMLGFVDSFAAVSSGGLSLTENYLYTRDALEAYYDHLSDDGVLAIIRWPSDVPRLVANAIDFLSKRGMPVDQIGQRVLAVSQREPKKIPVEGQPRPLDEPVETVFLLAKTPLTKERVDRLLAGHAGLYELHVPTRSGQAPYEAVFSGKTSYDQYTQAFETLATSVYDDRPFYFANEKPHGIPPFVMRLVALPLGAVVAFAALLLIGTRVAGFRAPTPRTIAYFGALGVGFIVCEIALMQRLILLLGHPIYTLVVILFTILLASSLGSLFARRFATEKIHAALGRITLAIVALMVLATLALPTIVHAALPLQLGARIALAAVIVFPFGFLMGMPFPLGLRRQALDPAGAPVSALWGINGVASVIGSIAAVVVAIVGGFGSALLAGAACYGVAFATRPR